MSSAKNSQPTRTYKTLARCSCALNRNVFDISVFTFYSGHGEARLQRMQSVPH